MILQHTLFMTYHRYTTLNEAYQIEDCYIKEETTLTRSNNSVHIMCRRLPCWFSLPQLVNFYLLYKIYIVNYQAVQTNVIISMPQNQVGTAEAANAHNDGGVFSDTRQVKCVLIGLVVAIAAAAVIVAIGVTLGVVLRCKY